MVGLAFYRSTVLAKRGLTIQQHNERVDMLNHKLYVMSWQCPNLMSWRHRGLHYPNVQILDNKGVHLSNEGYNRFACSIRGEIMYTEKVLHGNQ